jgi:hypothetical protein
MALRRRFIGLALASILVIGIVFLGSVPQATAETLTFKLFNHATKAEMFPIADVEGHFIGVVLKEGAVVYQNGEWAWVKSIQIRDLIKGAGTAEMYVTVTFLDGSSFIVHNKGTMDPTSVKWTGDIIHGTGRFQGIKGTYMSSAKQLPPEKGEPAGKSLAEGTIVYTLPSK